MKRYFLHLATMLLAGAGLLATSCSDSDPEETPQPKEPNFPTKVTPTVEIGGSYKISIEPNMKWQVSIPTEASAWFWLNSAGQTTVSGNEGKYEITVYTSDIKDYDTDHTVDVTMTMDGKSQIIATITRGHLEREFHLFPVKIDENNDFVVLENPQNGIMHDYETTETETATMSWPQGKGLFMTYLKAESNVDWAASGPEWLEAIPSGKAGETEIWLKGNPEKYPLLETTDKLTFYAADNKNIVLATVTVTIPGAESICQIDGFQETTRFDYKGKYYNELAGDWTEGPVRGEINSLPDAVTLYTLAKESAFGSVMFVAPAWLTAEIAAWDSSNTEVLQSRAIEIEAEANQGAAREAWVIALPKEEAALVGSDIEALVNETYDGLKEEYKQYVITTVKQAENPGPVSALYPDQLRGIGTSFSRGGDWMRFQFEVDNAYELVYTMPKSNGSAATLTMDRPYTNYRIFDYNMKPITDEAHMWLSLRKVENGFIVDMDPAKDPTSADSQRDDNVAHMGFIVLSDAEGDYAVIQCVYDEEKTVGGDVSVTFRHEQHTDDNSTVEEITSGPLYDEWNQGLNVPVYHLTFRKRASTLSTLLGIPQYSKVAPGHEEWLSTEFSEDLELFEITMVYMDPLKLDAEGLKTKTGAITYFFDEDCTRPALVLVCTLDLTAAE